MQWYVRDRWADFFDFMQGILCVTSLGVDLPRGISNRIFICVGLLHTYANRRLLPLMYDIVSKSLSPLLSSRYATCAFSHGEDVLHTYAIRWL